MSYKTNKTAGYNPESILKHRLLITIEDEI